ncbi:retron system putative HNH endonuclease [Pseudomonas rhizosphaerae]|uniref:retron system putative HNH endonuclease n=1 Tax=Pseudomonas rhizosphaerae TaxID=216142 RepID=UPI000694475D|nr:retron system putative HNH endonuclease [Pseudomonas rhizosphaerae]
MIKLKRPLKPQILKQNETTWTADYLAAKASGDTDAIDAAERKYRHKEIKNALRDMHQRKCAFCESFIEHVSYSHIEHFKPKKRYPKMLVRWSNLLLACGVCNGTAYKGEKFPTAAQDGPLINPANENPDDFLTYLFDPVANVALVGYKHPRGKTTIDTLGLNRPDLAKDIRCQVVKKLFALRKIIDQPNVQDDVRQPMLDILFEAADSGQHYSAFAKALLP